MDVFKHAKIARWNHFNADSLKTLKAKLYADINFYVYIGWLKYVGKILLRNSKRLQRKTANFSSISIRGSLV